MVDRIPAADTDGAFTLAEARVLVDCAYVAGSDGATKAAVEVTTPDSPHRRWATVRAMLEDADLPGPVRGRGLAVFGRLADAEARVHGIDPDQVHFHEVGALDSIADVVGVCAALHDLQVDAMSAGPVALGAGTVRTAHGELPVPVPAVAELASGWRVGAGGQGELTTPTGMALLVTLAERCQDLPPLQVHGVGMGAGTRDPAGRANVTRVVLGDEVHPRQRQRCRPTPEVRQCLPDRRLLAIGQCELEQRPDRRIEIEQPPVGELYDARRREGLGHRVRVQRRARSHRLARET